VTEPMRSKEEAMDYRYFPEPDLPPLVIDEDWIERVRASLPELPHARRARFIAEYDLPSRDAAFLTLERPLADFFETVATESGQPRTAANWVITELIGRLNAARKGIEDSPVRPPSLAALIRLIEDGTISGKIAKTIFDEMFTGGGEPAAIMKRKGLEQISDEGRIVAIVEKILAENPSQVETYRRGKTATLGWFVGQVMKATGGKANPKKVNTVLREKLKVE
jgi:aspartyl-tRNA(Asn)/glutamyl-tRNA(Gln) amidotransferase subunit B